MITRHARPARVLLALASFATPLLLAAPHALVAAPAVKDGVAKDVPTVPDVASPQNRNGNRDARPGQNRQGRQDRQGRQNRQGRGDREERGRRAREDRAQGLRRMMASMGFGDRALQDEVLQYIASEARARVQVRRKSQEIYDALRDPNKSDAEIQALLAQYQAVVEADRARRKEAENALNERIDFRSKPRLEAMLTLFGVIGDAPSPLAGGR